MKNIQYVKMLAFRYIKAAVWSFEKKVDLAI